MKKLMMTVGVAMAEADEAKWKSLDKRPIPAGWTEAKIAL